VLDAVQLDLGTPGGQRGPQTLDHPCRPVLDRRGVDAVQDQQVSDQLVAEHALHQRGIDQVQRPGEGLAVDLR
jgi:hypothetical protein